MKIIKLYFTFIALLLFNNLFSQSDTTFWFAAPEVSFNNSSNSNLDRPIELHVTAGNSASIVTISMPANPSFIPIVQSLAANATATINLTPWIDQIETKPANQVLNSGIVIKSTSKITAYYEVSSAGCNYCNPEFFTLKGNNAEGTNFFIPSQNFLDNSPNYTPVPKSSFDIVATENNTTISITPSKDIVGHIGGNLFTIVLNKGQTYSATAVSGLAANHLGGSVVSSDKKIAITVKDDLLAAAGGCADLGGDQTVPVTLLGLKYIAIRGYLNPPYDKLFVTAVSSNTQIKVDGIVVATINAGATFTINMPNPVSYIETSLPAYVLQLSGFGCEIGIAVLPPIECTGSATLSATRSAADGLFLNILVPAGGQNSFRYNGATGIINAADFTVVPATGGQWYYASKNISTVITPGGAPFSVSNTTARFQLGVIHGDPGWGCRFGYFSDYNTFKANISSNGPRFCSADTLRLHADSIANTIIQWTGPNGFNSTIANPKLFINNAGSSGYYKVTINDPACGIVTDSILVTVDITSVVTNTNATICSGNSIQLNATGASIYSWSPVTGLSNPNIANPIATPAVTTQYIVTGTKPSGCIGKDTVVISIAAIANFDFSYKQDVCNPLSVQFFHAGINPVNPYWSFGDGNTSLGNATPTNVYSAYGNYTVKYHIDNATCPDTVTKNISLQLSNADIVITPDTTICFGSTKQLRSQPALSFCWSPTTFLNNPLLPNPVTSTTAPITYYLTAEIVGSNIITNGNFSAGNTGFTSGYNYAANNTTEGEYFVGPNPRAWNASLSACTDHTTTTGNMLLVNGSPVANVIVWNQTVAVTPNTNYAFSTWIQALFPPNPAQLSFSINGLSIGNLITASLPTCTWTQFYTTWNSGNNTSASISIVNKNTIVQGNDFALDDISFSPVTIQRDSVKISIDTPVVAATGAATVCSGSPAQLNASGTATYSWLPITGLSNPNIANPIASPITTTNYTVTGTTINGCTATSAVQVTILPASNFDFSFQQNACNPLSVQFFHAGINPVNPYWSFGDGNTNLGNATATNVYPGYGTYTIKYHIDNATCPDTLRKIISLQLSNADIVITPDTTICFGSTKLLRALPSANFCWSPTTFLNNPVLNNPTTSTPTNITYYYTAEVSGNNLITNGDFSAGNTGFTSDYIFQATNSTTNAAYGITTNAQTWNADASACPDHTTGTGNMITANGATSPGKKLWKNTITVTPNTTYQFSAWIQTISLANFAVLKFYINDVQFGATLNAPSNACQWVQQKFNWNSGNNITANISLEDFTYAVDGNDFAVDDISFAAVSMKKDSVKITVDTPVVAATGTTTVCSGIPAQLNASGTATYLWTPATGLSNPNIANPLAAPAVNTTYTVTGTTVNGCTAQAAATITVLPKPVIAKIRDTIICNNSAVQLFASGGNSYVWTPAATLSNPNIANPVATPTAPITKYYVTVTNSNVNLCSSRDSVTVTLKPAPVFTVSPSKSTCQGTAVQLNASGGDTYLWNPPALVTNPAIRNPFTNTSSSTPYSVTITESICNISTTLSTFITITPIPVVNAISSNDINCSLGFANLAATGAAQYTWTPATGLSNPNVANPIATPVITTQYIVNGINDFGCKAADTVTVMVTTIGTSGYFMPNSFTPNGDTKNDCFGIKLWGIVQELEFVIYNRYGERVFYTTNPNKCWDGKYKTDKPEPGNYVYYIKAKTACGYVERKGNVVLIR